MIMYHNFLKHKHVRVAYTISISLCVKATSVFKESRKQTYGWYELQEFT